MSNRTEPQHPKAAVPLAGLAALLFLGLLFSVGFLSLALNEATANTSQIRQASGVINDLSSPFYRTGVDDAGRTDVSNDPTGDNTVGIATVTTEAFGDRPVIAVSARFTTAAATATVVVERANYTGSITDTGTGTWTPLDEIEFTLTAGTRTDGNGHYLSDVRYVDSDGCTVYKILAYPSAGTVSLVSRSY